MKFGIYTFIVESPLKKGLKEVEEFYFKYLLSIGWGNGYVLLPPNHPFYEDDDIDVNVHGGLTFSSLFNSEHFLELIKNRDFDGDITKENFEKFNNYWMIGFDTGHFEDNEYNCPKEYVMSETLSLVDQCLSDDIKGMKKYKSIYLRRDKLKEINKL